MERELPSPHPSSFSEIKFPALSKRQSQESKAELALASSAGQNENSYIPDTDTLTLYLFVSLPESNEFVGMTCHEAFGEIDPVVVDVLLKLQVVMKEGVGVGVGGGGVGGTGVGVGGTGVGVGGGGVGGTGVGVGGMGVGVGVGGTQLGSKKHPPSPNSSYWQV